MSLSVQRLFIYPVKSLQPVELDAVELTETGLRFDRSFALVYAPTNDSTAASESLQLVRHLTIKKVFKAALFQPSIDASWTKLNIKYLGVDAEPTLTVPLTPSPLNIAAPKKFLLSIFGTNAIGIDMGEHAASFFTQHLGLHVRLVFIGGRGHREIPGARFASDWLDQASNSRSGNQTPQRIQFADAAPLLITSTASEHDARCRLPESDRDEDLLLRFRSNIHINVGDLLPAFDEDNWRLLKVHNNNEASKEVLIKCVYPCVRCLSINADLKTGTMANRERQLYGLLARDRRINPEFPKKPAFGQYAFGGPVGAIVRVGDRVSIIERSSC